MAILALKLVSGEDLVGDVSFDESANEYIVKEPAQLLVLPSKDPGQPSFGFLPFPIYAQRSSNYTLKFQKSHVTMTTEVGTDFVNQYNTMFGSGIVTPPKNIII